MVSGEAGVSSDMIVGIEDSCGFDERVVRVLRWSDRELFVDRRTRTPHSSLALHGGQLRHSAQNDDHFHDSSKCARLRAFLYTPRLDACGLIFVQIFVPNKPAAQPSQTKLDIAYILCTMVYF